MLGPKATPEERKLNRLYLARPDLFIKHELGWNLWEKQIEVAMSVRDNKETYVQSCNAAGKTQLAAGLVLWWLLTRRGKVVTTAPTWRQVKDLLWEKIREMANGKPGLGLAPLQTDIKITDNWFATGVSTNDSSNIQGYHGNVLVIVDEACGVEKEEIWTAIDGDITDDRNDRLLAVGNPTNPETPFARRCYNPTPRSKTIKISAYDTPNVREKREVIPGLVTYEWVMQKKEEWGENSPYYLARILGEFPRTASDSLFPLSWLDAAFEYDTTEQPDISSGTSSIGFDVSASGSDNNAMTFRTGGKVQALVGWPGIDTSELVVGDANTNHPSLYQWIDTYMPEVVFIDAVGIGKPIYDYARKHKKSNDRYKLIRIRPFIAQKLAIKEAQFANTKAEAYWQFRERLRLGELDLSKLRTDQREELERQANAIRWQPDNKGRVLIEKKERMKARVGFSPDELESMIMAFYGGGANKVDVNATARFDYNSATRDERDGVLVANFDYRMSA